MLAGRAHHQKAQTGPCLLRIKLAQDREWIVNIRSTPRRARLGYLKISARSGASSLQLDPCFGHAEQLPRLMLREHTGDVIVDDDNVIHFAEPLLGKHSDGRGAA